MTASVAHKCLAECQSNLKDFRKILSKWGCTITFETEQINGEQFKCVAILSDGQNQITASEYIQREYYSYMRKIHALASLLGCPFNDENLKKLFQ